MKHSIPYNKMSKREQKNEDSKRRNFWTINPMTRIVPNNKQDIIKKEMEKEINYLEED